MSPVSTARPHRPALASLRFPRRIRRRIRLAALAMAAIAVIATAVSQSAQADAAAGGPTSKEAAQAVVIRVQAPSAAQLRRLTAAYDVLEVRRGADFLVMGDGSTARTLRAQGYRAKVEQVLAPLPAAVKPVTAARDAALSPKARLAAAAYATFYGGYHTTDAQLQHVRDVAAAYPALATVVDYGDSWRKTRGLTGSDLLAICITKIVAGDCARSTTAPKPRSTVVSAIHSRELATAEITWNWIDYLTQNYGVDPSVTSLLNTTEIWVIPVLNPDGRKIVESGGNSPYLQRKNADNLRGNCANPPTGSNQYGVDLNRNATFHWGGVGSSTSACTQTYRGTAAASEPETQALQGLLNSLYADKRGPNIGDAAPSTTTGTFMTYHSYAGLVLYPWGDVNTPAPNGAKLQTLAAQLALNNGYTYGQPGNVLYNVSGTTDDDLYGRLGVASFTTELGAVNTSCDGFTPPFSCVASRFWPQERGSLLALGQAAAGPYR